jgi:hypothetical protein
MPCEEWGANGWVGLGLVWCSYEVKLPSTEARSKFFSQLVDAAVAVPRRRAISGSKQKEVLPELPKAPKVVKGPSEAELRERAEVEENHLRRLRMCFRDICNRWGVHPARHWVWL